MRDQILNCAIFGAGIVGQATASLLKLETHFYDPPKGLNEVTFQEDIAIICVPTDRIVDERGFPSLGHDYQHLYHAIDLLKSNDFKGIVCVRSTSDALTIGSLLITHFEDLVFWPEFLREASWREDSENPGIVVLGGNRAKELSEYLQSIGYGKNAEYFMTDAVTAAIAKLSINSYLAVKVAMMNVIHEVAEKHNADYNMIADIMVSDGRIGTSHMEVPGPDGKFGFGGKCFPKDLSALAKDSEVDFLEDVLKYNDTQRRKTT